MMDKKDPKFRPDELPREHRERSRYDPEHEIPDPDRVEQDIEEVEKVYRDDETEEPAA
ncbi:MAG TPA: hypothetical protein VD837_04515 [Terriglobales bacterium]|nr:hypothetical protein [Terriglobales bacterium]